MQISIKRLNEAGFRADFDTKRQTLSIYPERPVEIDWDAMRDQWRDIGLTPYAVDAGLEAFHTEVEMHQIMQACRG